MSVGNVIWLAVYRTYVLETLSSAASYCSFLIIKHHLYVDYCVILLMCITQPESKAQKKHTHVGKLYEVPFI